MYICMYVYGPPMGTPREAIIKGYCSISMLDTNQYSTLALRRLSLLVYTSLLNINQWHADQSKIYKPQFNFKFELYKHLHFK